MSIELMLLALFIHLFAIGLAILITYYRLKNQRIKSDHTKTNGNDRIRTSNLRRDKSTL